MNTSMFPNYARDIERHWKYKEIHRPNYNFSSPQLQLRSHLIKWLRNVSEKINVSCRTFHLATYMLDMFMDCHNITMERLGFVALVCLMLAVKFEEIDSKIPKISELNKFDGFRYSNKDFVNVELMVLKSLKFELSQPTIAHFAEYYAFVIVIPQDQKKSKYSLRSLADFAGKIIGEFLDICLLETKFLMIKPSQAAAACMFATRLVMKLSPAWTNVLSDVTGYKQEDIMDCVKLLIWRMQELEVKRNRHLTSPDPGYVSESP